MRTLALLAALLLLALQAQAETLQDTAAQVPAQDELWAEDQDQAADDDQDMTISFTGEERPAREAAGLQQNGLCTCRSGRFCRNSETPSGFCRINGRRYKRCCR